MELTEHEKKEYYAKWCFVAVVYKDDFQLTIEKERINFQKQEKRIVRGKKNGDRNKRSENFQSVFFEVISMLL